MPGLHAVYAVFMAVFGNSNVGIHLGLLFVNLATLILMYFLGRRLFDTTTGVMASAALAVLSLSHRILGFSTNAEPLVLLPALSGILFLLRAIDSGKPRDYFISGFLLGLAFVIKQPGIYFIAFGGFYLLYANSQKVKVVWPRFLTECCLYAAGAVIPFALTCAFFLLAGDFDKFWFWTFEYAFSYGSAKSLSYGLENLKRTLNFITAPTLMFWILALTGLTALMWDKRARTKAAFVVAFLALSFFSVTPGMYFRPHYFILFLPALALLNGIAVSSFAELFCRSRYPVLRKGIPISLALLAIALTLFQERAYLFTLSPEMVSRMTYGANPFVESLEIARYIKENTAPDDRIAILGSEPQIYFYSERRAATKHIVMYPITGEHEYALELQKDMISEIEANQPEIFIYVKIRSSWSRKPKTPKLIFDWLNEYSSRYYDRVGIVDIPFPKPTEYYWDEESIGYSPQSKHWISVFKRKR
jgi:4-amino-4-deoxy-L-arabinose transferase-like glycosyltransferase